MPFKSLYFTWNWKNALGNTELESIKIYWRQDVINKMKYSTFQTVEEQKTRRKMKESMKEMPVGVFHYREW